MSYTVLARRYRPRGFDELIGQESVARTLRNAIDLNRTAHAYLFCGTRGVGKTSMARIFAAAMNAGEHVEGLTDREGVINAIFRGDDLDVIEIDAASNTGVDNVRDLIANAGLSPARCPYKIYIIDEVHMLSKSAFNALLKIMEEPPSHVKFVLCTTEPERIPATIQSRCQRFDFRAISTAKIAEHLRIILNEESIEADDGAIMQLARLGNGSLRDALSLTDRLLATGATPITAGDVEELLGIPDQSVIVDLVGAIAARDPKQAIQIGATLMERGVSIDLALDMLADHLRTVIVIAATGENSELLDIGEERRQRAAEQAKSFTLPGLVHMIALCDSVARSAKSSAAGRALFDALIVRMCLTEQFEPIETATADATIASTDSKKKATDPPVAPQRTTADFTHSTGAQPDAKPAVAVEPKPADHPPAAPPPAPDTPLAQSNTLQTTDDTTASEPSQGAKDAMDVTDVADAADVGGLWRKFTDHIHQANDVSMLSLIEGLDAATFDGRVLVLNANEDGLSMIRRLRSQQDKLADRISAVIGRRVQIAIRTPEDDPNSPGADTMPHHAAAAPDATPSQDVVRNDPLVRSALELFDGSVVRVEKCDPH